MIGVVPDNHRLLLLQPIDIPARFVAGRIERIALVNRPHGNSIVVFGGNMLWRTRGISQRNFERRDFCIDPGFGIVGWKPPLVSSDRPMLATRKTKAAITNLFIWCLPL
jgi:hypothetical protein